MTIPMDAVAWPGTPCPPATLPLRSALARLELAVAGALTDTECAGLARLFHTWTDQGTRDPRLFLLGAECLVNNATALVDGADQACLRTSAYHEAGHAVVALLAGVPILKVTIEADPVGGWLGCCYLAKRSAAPGISTRAQAEVHAEITMAGPLAEGLGGMAPSANTVAMHREDALRELMAAGPVNGTAECKAHLEYIRERTAGRLQQCWNAVDGLARHLQSTRTVAGAEAERLILAALPEGVHPATRSNGITHMGERNA